MAISVTNLTVANNLTNQGTSGTPYVTASITLHAGKLGLLAIASHRTSGAAEPSSVSGPGSTTWVKIANVQFFSIATPLANLTLYRACNAADQTGTITITYAATQSNCFWSVNEVSGSAATSGNNGSDGIRQSVTNRTDSAASPFTVTLAAFGSASNAGFCAFHAKSTTQSYAAGSGLTGLGDAQGSGSASDSGDIFAEWAINVAAQQATYTTAWSQGGVAVEIIAAAGGAAGEQPIVVVRQAVTRSAYF